MHATRPSFSENLPFVVARVLACPQSPLGLDGNLHRFQRSLSHIDPALYLTQQGHEGDSRTRAVFAVQEAYPTGEFLNKLNNCRRPEEQFTRSHALFSVVPGSLALPLYLP